jgi:hypothetical protein
MFSHTISIISTFSIVIAAILGVIRFRNIEKSYYPFIYICWLAIVFEILAAMFQATFTTLWPSNVYVLLEGLIFTWQFKKWGSFHRRPFMLYVIQVFIVGLWIADNIIIRDLHQVSSNYRIGYSILLVVLAIDHINKLIVQERKSFLTNAKFLICTGVVIFFSYKIVVEIFYLYVYEKNATEFVTSILAIQKYVNLFTNLLFAYCVLWIPSKKIFLKPLR